MKRLFFGVLPVLGVLGVLSSGAWGQVPVHIGGEGAIGSETLTSATIEGVDVAAVPGGAWSANGGTGVVESTLNSPEVTLAEAGEVILSFDHRYYFEDDGTTRWDAGAVFVSKNGGEFEYVEETAFTENTYDGAGAGEDGRFITGNSPPLNGFFAFNNQSLGFLAGATITSVANLGTFAVGDRVQVRFWGAWDEGFIQTPGPNWE
ncbi:MAG: hypothetical protein P8J87_16925, partial [Verrucomicrobiales bacterium]|nr:hypothetical protein [Verrucomicrobiales bacterium]